MNKMVPCPNCGEDRFNRIVTRGRDNRFFIDHYDNIFHLRSSVGFDREEDAAEAWNRLFSPPEVHLNRTIRKEGDKS